jgi:hypothetical protein
LSTIISSFATVSCDGECGKTVTFAQTQEGEKEALATNPWLNTMRLIQRLDKKQFSYCSDECEIKSAGAGNHNTPEEKKIQTVVNQSQVDLAARAAHAAAEATKAMKSGIGIQVHQ